MINNKVTLAVILLLFSILSCTSTKTLVEIGCQEYDNNITGCLDKNYADNTNNRQSLNLWLPCKINECNKKFPLIIHIHGGGFAVGEKMEHPNFDLLRAGFAFSSINYRLIPENSFPDYLHDAKAAIRWFRGNSEELKIDASKIGIYGESAGGALTSYLAFTNGVNEVEIDGNIIDVEGNIGSNINESSEINGAINYFGHADSEMFCDLKKGLDPNCEDTSDFCHSCKSPISYIGNGSSVPYMIIHGTDDNVVPYIHGEMLNDKFKKMYPNNNPELTFITVENGTHGIWDRKTFDELNRITKNFFNRNILNNNDFNVEESRKIISEKIDYHKNMKKSEIQKNER